MLSTPTPARPTTRRRGGAAAGAAAAAQAGRPRLERRRIHLRSATDDPRVHSAEGSKVVEKYLGLPAQQGQTRLSQAVADKNAQGGRVVGHRSPQEEGRRRSSAVVEWPGGARAIVPLRRRRARSPMCGGTRSEA